MKTNQLKTENFEQIDIDNRDKNYSDDDILRGLKKLIEYKEKIFDEDGIEFNLYDRLLAVCYAISYLSDEKLLDNTLDYLKIFGLIEDIENTGIDLSTYSEIDVIIIKAKFYSLTSRYKLIIKNLKFPNSKSHIKLEIRLNNRVIEHNLKEVLRSIQINNLLKFENNISKLPINEQKKAIDKWIRSASSVGLSKGTNMFDFEVRYLDKISNHLIEPNEPIIPQSEYGFKITLKHIALKAYFEGKFITRENASTFLKGTKFKSGEALYQDFISFADNTDRKANPESKPKLKYRIKLFKEVIELLPENKRDKAIDELKILENYNSLSN